MGSGRPTSALVASGAAGRCSRASNSPALGERHGGTGLALAHRRMWKVALMGTLLVSVARVANASPTIAVSDFRGTHADKVRTALMFYLTQTLRVAPAAT